MRPIESRHVAEHCVGDEVRGTVDLDGARALTVYPGADLATAIFALGVAARPWLASEPSRVAGAWCASQALDSEGFASHGRWSRGMEEAFGQALVEYFEGAHDGGGLSGEAAALAREAAAALTTLAGRPAGDSFGREFPPDVRAALASAVNPAKLREAIDAYGPSARGADAGRVVKAVVRTGAAAAPVSGDAQGPSYHPPRAQSDARYDNEASAWKLRATVISFIALLFLGGGTALFISKFILHPSAASAEQMAETVRGRLAERQYGAIRDAGTKAFREAAAHGEFQQIVDLSRYGRLMDITPVAPPVFDWKVEPATMTTRYNATYIFGAGPIEVTLAAPRGARAWQVATVTQSVQPTTLGGPYPATEEGADALVRRFLYICKLPTFKEDVRAFLTDGADENDLESFQDLVTGGVRIDDVERTSYEPGFTAYGEGAEVVYNVRATDSWGAVTFFLVKRDGVWDLRGAYSKMRWRR